MLTINYKGQLISCKLTNNNIHIVDSYKIRNAEDMLEILAIIRSKAAAGNFRYKRSTNSWLTEWKAHNYMYDKNIQRNRTASVDLNEDESCLKLVGYAALALLYRG